MVDGDALGAGDVDDLAGEGFGGAGGEEVGMDDVVDVGEVAGLLAVAVDEGGFAGGDGFGEGGDDGGVGGVGVLARAEDVEVTEGDGV